MWSVCPLTQWVLRREQLQQFERHFHCELLTVVLRTGTEGAYPPCSLPLCCAGAPSFMEREYTLNRTRKQISAHFPQFVISTISTTFPYKEF